jgi:4'-phosphopantetheinyl transferase
VIDGVHIWRAALDDPNWPGPGGLPADERERADGLLREEAARRWVAARWALRRALSQYLGVEPAAVELEIGENGKPRLAGGSGLEFNLSHSGGLALVAVAERQVGVDVELIAPRQDLPALAERALPATDAAAVRAAPAADRAAVFYAAWTRHEARLKCLGSGLGSVPAWAQVAVESLNVAPGYAAAVAVAWTEVGPVRCRSLP